MRGARTRSVGEENKPTPRKRKKTQHNIIFHDEIFEDEAESALFDKIQQEHFEDSLRYAQELKRSRRNKAIC